MLLFGGVVFNLVEMIVIKVIKFGFVVVEVGVIMVDIDNVIRVDFG